MDLTYRRRAPTVKRGSSPSISLKYPIRLIENFLNSRKPCYYWLWRHFLEVLLYTVLQGLVYSFTGSPSESWLPFVPTFTRSFVPSFTGLTFWRSSPSWIVWSCHIKEHSSPTRPLYLYKVKCMKFQKYVCRLERFSEHSGRSLGKLPLWSDKGELLHSPCRKIFLVCSDVASSSVDCV